jgi:hypothetical protein
MADLPKLLRAVLEALKKRAPERDPIRDRFRPAPSVSAEAKPQPAPSQPGSEAAARAPEAGLVRALFANPRSLAAAFVAAEILAKPVALRDTDGRGSAL